MKTLAVCLALGVLPAFGGSRDVPVRLYTSFQQTPPDAVLDSMQEELANILGPLGVVFEWRSLALATGNEVSAELVVIHFKGRCDALNLEPVDGIPGPLGWTHMSDGEILPFTDVNCDGIRLFMQRELLALPATERQAAYGRALARVLAHELYHIFARTTRHASWGIAKPAYSARDLLAPKLQFERKEGALLRAHQLHLDEVNGADGQ